MHLQNAEQRRSTYRWMVVAFVFLITTAASLATAYLQTQRHQQTQTEDYSQLIQTINVQKRSAATTMYLASIDSIAADTRAYSATLIVMPLNRKILRAERAELAAAYNAYFRAAAHAPGTQGCPTNPNLVTPFILQLKTTVSTPVTGSASLRNKLKESLYLLVSGLLNTVIRTVEHCSRR